LGSVAFRLTRNFSPRNRNAMRNLSPRCSSQAMQHLSESIRNESSGGSNRRDPNARSGVTDAIPTRDHGCPQIAPKPGFGKEKGLLGRTRKARKTLGFCYFSTCLKQAEREGFEPSVGLRPHRFSRPARSAAPAPLLCWRLTLVQMSSRLEAVQSPRKKSI